MQRRRRKKLKEQQPACVKAKVYLRWPVTQVAVSYTQRVCQLARLSTWSSFKSTLPDWHCLFSFSFSFSASLLFTTCLISVRRIAPVSCRWRDDDEDEEDWRKRPVFALSFLRLNRLAVLAAPQDSSALLFLPLLPFTQTQPTLCVSAWECPSPCASLPNTARRRTGLHLLVMHTPAVIQAWPGHSLKSAMHAKQWIDIQTEKSAWLKWRGKDTSLSAQRIPKKRRKESRCVEAFQIAAVPVMAKWGNR